ncbi:hypothetical protein BGW36DRAFT_432817 [Talaromyces proteolyticus]|uniref:Uncharacterized protein n=1 Tax=Talaromyces proteolyticus TaxID=1131652 RepID=A0AAD4KJB1_9EURO|nr:uncharacterized protein BGW36DRAFT_432817 [Talaromyces proteolyticus]KAH8689851.1 hypothetical protein BGW36DRAFT_432817 [Talaromyces proteolyticus]
MSGNYHLLFGLSSNTSQHEYQNNKHFLSVLNQELDIFTADQSKSQYILFTGVTNEVFRRDFTDPIDSLTDFEIYSITHELIIVKMESHTHAHAHSVFNALLIRKLVTMNDHDKDIRYFASAHVQGDDRKKRADQIYQPKRLPRHRSRHWPSLVLEVGYTEGQRKLESDINWWITQSNGDVKSAVTIAVNPRVKQIVICQWYGNNPQQRVYRNALSQNDQGAIQTSNPNPLVIPFAHLFLRQPSGNEQDITFTIAELKELAKNVWEVQFEE